MHTYTNTHTQVYTHAHTHPHKSVVPPHSLTMRLRANLVQKRYTDKRAPCKKRTARMTSYVISFFFFLYVFVSLSLISLTHTRTHAYTQRSDQGKLIAAAKLIRASDLSATESNVCSLYMNTVSTEVTQMGMFSI